MHERSKSCRAMPNANSLSKSEPRARRTRRPTLCAAMHVASRIAVLPMPARPSTTKTPPRRTDARTVASSNSRSRSLIASAMVAWRTPDYNIRSGLNSEVSTRASYYPSSLQGRHSLPTSSSGGALAHLASLLHQASGGFDALPGISQRLVQFVTHLRLSWIGIAQSLQQIDIVNQSALPRSSYEAG